MLHFPMFWTNAAREHRTLGTLYDEAASLLGDPDAHCFERAAHVSGWTPAQHLHHVFSINDSIFAWLRTQCEGAPAEHAGGSPNVAGYVMLGLGWIPRGRGRSPTPFVPPEAVPPADLEAQMAESCAALDALGPCTARMSALDGRRRHPHMGLLDATQWTRFARMHTEHHLRIIRDIVSEQAEVTT